VRRFLPLLFVAVLALVPYRDFFTSRVPIGRDLPFYFLPIKAHLAEAVRAGEVPWIDRYRWGGAPLLAAPGAAAFHPANLLFLLLPLGTAVKGWTLLHLLVGLAGFAALARRLELSAPAAATAGLLFALSGISVSLAPFLGAQAALAVLPWVAAALLDLRRGPTAARTLRLALACASLFVTAVPELCLYALIVAAALLIGPWRTPEAPPVRRGWRLAVTAAMLLGAALAMPALLPAYLSGRESVRGPGGGTNPTFAAMGSLPPVRLPELALDGVVADWTRVGGTPEVPDYPYLPSLTPGRVALLLGFLGLLRGGLGRWQALLLVALGLLLALGPATPVWRLAVRALPPLAALRYPEKHLILTGFGLAWLAALGLKALEERLPEPARRWAAPLLALAVLLDRQAIARGLSPTGPGDVLTVPPPILAPMAETTAPSPPRLLHHDSLAPVPVFDKRDLAYSNLLARATVMPGFGSLFGAGYLFELDYDLTLPRSAFEWTRLLKATASAGSPLTLRVARATGVSWIERSEVLPSRRYLPRCAPITDPLPPYRFAGRALHDADASRLWRRLLQEGFDPDTAYVAAPFAGGRPLARGSVLSLADGASALAITAEVPAGRDGLLAVYRLFESVEEARLDGRRAAVLPMAFGFAAVRVPEGRHLLELRPPTSWVKIGLAVSIASVLVLVLLHRRGRARIPT